MGAVHLVTWCNTTTSQWPTNSVALACISPVATRALPSGIKKKRWKCAWTINYWQLYLCRAIKSMILLHVIKLPPPPPRPFYPSLLAHSPHLVRFPDFKDPVLTPFDQRRAIRETSWRDFAIIAAAEKYLPTVDIRRASHPRGQPGSFIYPERNFTLQFLSNICFFPLMFRTFDVPTTIQGVCFISIRPSTKKEWLC